MAYIYDDGNTNGIALKLMGDRLCALVLHFLLSESSFQMYIQQREREREVFFSFPEDRRIGRERGGEREEEARWKEL